jgi:hypothetical protein
MGTMIKIIAVNDSLEIAKMYGVKLNYIAIYIFIQCVILNT